MSRRGFTLTEILVVMALLSFGFLSLLTVYTTNLRHATMTRSRLLATMLCESVLFELREHRYGTPAPPTWGDAKAKKPYLQVYPVWVQGRPVQTSFEVLVKVGPEGNGSFFDSSKKDPTDVVQCNILWVEGTDDASSQAKKELHFTLVVRREPDLAVSAP